MSDHDLSVLKDRQQSSLQLCDFKLRQWTEFCNEYKALKENLETITDKTRHSVMVPIVQNTRNRPPIALVPGFVHHTNEILVLLGDNWFSERSAKEAIEIVERRLKRCENTLSQLEQERNQILTWMSFTEKIIEEKNDLVEIIEEYDENEEQKWREEHKRKVKEFKQEEARLKLNQTVDESRAEQSDCSKMLNEAIVEERMFPIKSILKKKAEERCLKTEKSSDAEHRECKNADDDVSTFSTANLAASTSDRQSEDAITKRAEKPFTGEIIERTECQTTKKEELISGAARTVSKFKKERRK